MSPRYATIEDNKRLNEIRLYDPLATDRTILANERTFLAYIRTAMTMLVGGISLISFFNQHLVIFLGWIALIPALYLFWKGASHYYWLKKNLFNPQTANLPKTS